MAEHMPLVTITLDDGTFLPAATTLTSLLFRAKGKLV